jgi:hypothetical protein
VSSLQRHSGKNEEKTATMEREKSEFWWETNSNQFITKQYADLYYEHVSPIRGGAPTDGHNQSQIFLEE